MRSKNQIEVNVRSRIKPGPSGTIQKCITPEGKSPEGQVSRSVHQGFYNL